MCLLWGTAAKSQPGRYPNQNFYIFNANTYKIAAK
jgi:hypothetical protein